MVQDKSRESVCGARAERRGACEVKGEVGGCGCGVELLSQSRPF